MKEKATSNKQPRAMPEWAGEIDIKAIERIDAGLEGDWSASVKTLWTRETGFREFPESTFQHPRFKPALELYFHDGWIGMHCYRIVDANYVLDKEKAEAVIRYVARG